MRAKGIEDRMKDMILSLNIYELKVYSGAMEHFALGETYQNTPDPLRRSLQHDYASFVLERFQREKRSRRPHEALAA